MATKKRGRRRMPASSRQRQPARQPARQNVEAPVIAPRAREAPREARRAESTKATVNWAEEYRYVLHDLKRTGIVAAAMIITLVVLALTIR